MFELLPSEVYKRRLKEYCKKHPEELKRCFDNLDKYLEYLNIGIKPGLITKSHLGSLHIEPHGIRAVDQKGGGGKLKETRLYFFTEEETKTVHLITIGNKNSQSEDIKETKQYLKKIKSFEL